MKVTYNWLKEYVDFPFSPEELAQRLTMLGLEVDSIERSSYLFEGVVIGQIVRAEKHPTVPRLWNCLVDVGQERLSIVCGAPNVTVNLKVPVALQGAKLSDGRVVEQSFIHGQKSEGMICSEAELGLSQRSDIIMILDDDSPVGEKLSTYLGEEETVLEIDLTPNRPDCLSIIGVAREIAAICNNRLKKPAVSVHETEDRIENFASVVILNPETCPRYSARVIHNVKVGPSPWWLVKKLEAVGIRSINNVVDITNYVMMETGQPLHAFDYNLLAEGKIVVRNAHHNEKFVTLDGKEHLLDETTLMICDAQKPVAIAGVMGGLNSEVSSDTTTVLLESAYFNPLSIRRTSKSLNISSESSQRFERGTDPNGVLYALDRASQLLSEIASGQVVRGVIDCNPRPITPQSIELRPHRVNLLLGTHLDDAEMVDLLRTLEFNVIQEDNLIKVKVPTFRPDISREVDLIEEVARIYGYNRIGDNTRCSIDLRSAPNQVETLENTIREVFTGMGFNEVLTNSLLSERVASTFSYSKPPIVLKNPLSEDLSALRPSLIPGLLQVIKWNKNRKINDIQIFELGNVFHWVNKPETPGEEKKIAAAVTGKKGINSWREKPKEIEFFDLKGQLELLFKKIALNGFKWVATKTEYTDHRTLGIEVDTKRIGFLGALTKKMLDLYDISDDVFIVELSFQQIFESVNWYKKYEPIPKYPSVKRDLALLVDAHLPVEELEQEIWRVGGKILKSVRLFDLYVGEQIPTNKKSVAFSLEFYSPQRTLTEEEVDVSMRNIIAEARRNLEAELRAAS